MVTVLVLCGAKKLPELARSLGQGMNEFRKAREDFDKELHAAGNEVTAAESSGGTAESAFSATNPSVLMEGTRSRLRKA